jgi:hypothetical protein
MLKISTALEKQMQIVSQNYFNVPTSVSQGTLPSIRPRSLVQFEYY